MDSVIVVMNMPLEDLTNQVRDKSLYVVPRNEKNNVMVQNELTD